MLHSIAQSAWHALTTDEPYRVCQMEKDWGHRQEAAGRQTHRSSPSLSGISTPFPESALCPLDSVAFESLPRAAGAGRRWLWITMLRG